MPSIHAEEDALAPLLVRDDQHKEPSNSHSDVIRDATIGLADGLTVPFALTAGLSSLGDTKLVILGGLAELFSGASTQLHEFSPTRLRARN